MKREPVESSKLKSLGYNPESRILEAEFHDGAIYQYADVPAYVYDIIMASESKGKAFHQLVELNKYDYERVNRHEK